MKLGGGESLRAGFHGDTDLPFSLYVASHPLGDGDQTRTRKQRVRREREDHKAGGWSCELQSHPFCHILFVPAKSHGRSGHRKYPPGQWLRVGPVPPVTLKLKRPATCLAPAAGSAETRRMGTGVITTDPSIRREEDSRQQPPPGAIPDSSRLTL